MRPIQNVHKLSEQVYGGWCFRLGGEGGSPLKSIFCSNESSVNQGQVLSCFRKASYYSHKVNKVDCPPPPPTTIKNFQQDGVVDFKK